MLFIRHNGGSVWIEPPPGAPWQKHESCFPSSNGAGKSLLEESYLRIADSASNKVLGVIERIELDLARSETLLVVRFENGDTARLRVAELAEIQGELVICDIAKMKVSFWRNASQVWQIIARE